MNKNLFLQEAEQYLTEKLDKNLFSFELDNSFNEYHTFIYIRVLKSGNLIKIGCSYCDNRINFWNNFDEEFVQPLSVEGLAKILETAFEEKSVEYSFSFVSDNRAEYKIYLKADKADNRVIFHELSKILAESEIEYGHIIFADFFGEINMQITFNGETEKFEINQTANI